MKKVIALALAMILTAGLSSVAFADTDPAYTLEANMFWEASNGEIRDSASLAANAEIATITPGEVVYIRILKDGAATTAKDQSDVKKLKAFAEWSVGKSDGNPTIEYKKIEGEFTYAVAVKLPANSSTKLADLAGDITLGRTKKAAEGNGVELKASIGYVKYDGDFDGNYDEKAPVVKFAKDAGEIEITWDDVAAFEVNATGQGDLNIKYNVKFNKDFADKYDYANIDFVTFTQKPSFNRTGTLKIYTENEDSFIYEVTADGAKAISGAKYDASEGAWIFKTRTLGSYAISDKELKTTTSSSSEAPAPSEGSSSEGTTGKPNPDTGR